MINFFLHKPLFRLGLIGEFLKDLLISHNQYVGLTWNFFSSIDILYHESYHRSEERRVGKEC